MKTFGDRLTAIRVALGSQRKPFSLRKLEALIRETTHYSVSHETLRQYELNNRPIRLADAVAIAAVDPEHRGVEWLAGDDPKALDVDNTQQAEAQIAELDKRFPVNPGEPHTPTNGREKKRRA
jgi:transcriptional regulator with XRE-family HTH domain